MTDAINHPRYYNAHPSGIEAIQLCEWLSFSTGNALKYVWRAGQKGSRREDLSKALWYIRRERTRFETMAGSAPGVPLDFVECAQHVIQSEPRSLLATMVALLALPKRIELEHLDGARWHLEQEIAKIKVHKSSMAALPFCNTTEVGPELDIEDGREVTCEECRRLA